MQVRDPLTAESARAILDLLALGGVGPVVAGEDSHYGAILDWLNGRAFLDLVGAVIGVEGPTRATADPS